MNNMQEGKKRCFYKTRILLETQNCIINRMKNTAPNNTFYSL